MKEEATEPRSEKMDVHTMSNPLGGAWASYYHFGDTAPVGTARAYGIIALKKELIYNGFSKGIVPDLPAYGDAVRNRAKDFQLATTGLLGDGVIGPKTALALFHKRIKEQQDLYEIPDDLVCKQISLESGFDPAATGTVDPRDRGLPQINSGAHPEITDSKAFDPAFSIPWTAKYLANNISLLGGDVVAAVAAHNVGNYYAKKWMEAGKPSSGLLTSGGKDYAAIASKYVALVYSRTC